MFHDRFTSPTRSWSSFTRPSEPYIVDCNGLSAVSWSLSCSSRRTERLNLYMLKKIWQFMHLTFLHLQLCISFPLSIATWPMIGLGGIKDPQNMHDTTAVALDHVVSGITVEFDFGKWLDLRCFLEAHSTLKVIKYTKLNRSSIPLLRLLPGTVNRDGHFVLH